MLGLSGILSYAVFVYLFICFFVIARLINVNIIFHTPKQSLFQKKYHMFGLSGTLSSAVFVYFYLCICV